MSEKPLWSLVLTTGAYFILARWPEFIYIPEAQEPAQGSLHPYQAGEPGGLWVWCAQRHYWDGSYRRGWGAEESGDSLPCHGQVFDITKDSVKSETFLRTVGSHPQTSDLPGTLPLWACDLTWKIQIVELKQRSWRDLWEGVGECL